MLADVTNMFPRPQKKVWINLRMNLNYIINIRNGAKHSPIQYLLDFNREIKCMIMHGMHDQSLSLFIEI